MGPSCQMGSELRKTRKINSPFTYVPARCRGEPCVRPRTNNAFVPMYDGRTQGSPLHRAGTQVNEEFIFRAFLNMHCNLFYKNCKH